MHNQDTAHLVAEQIRQDMRNPIIAASPFLGMLLDAEGIEVPR
ncbi:MAG TPA: hypothetical protein PLB92_00635 [Rhodoglobus sp.]|nr:hypothetical protein [Rhodoglobus sp.]